MKRKLVVLKNRESHKAKSGEVVIVGPLCKCYAYGNAVIIVEKGGYGVAHERSTMIINDGAWGERASDKATIHVYEGGTLTDGRIAL